MNLRKFRFTFFTVCLLLFSFWSAAQLPNAVNSVNLFLDLNLELSVTEEIYQVIFEVEQDSSVTATHYRCKIGTTDGGTEILDKSIAVDGSNAASEGVELITEGNIVKIDFGELAIPIEFFAEVVASDGTSSYEPVKFF